MEHLIIQTVKCLRCGHEWVPRTPEPQQCPRCGSRKWTSRQEGAP